MQADLADAGVEALPLPTLPLAAFVTGALSGLFGIGGGLLLNPVLLQIGIPPQVVRYTTTTPRAFAFLPNVAAKSIYIGTVPVNHSILCICRPRQRRLRSWSCSVRPCPWSSSSCWAWKASGRPAFTPGYASPARSRGSS
jgi:hypothetical protein